MPRIAYYATRRPFCGDWRFGWLIFSYEHVAAGFARRTLVCASTGAWKDPIPRLLQPEPAADVRSWGSLNPGSSWLLLQPIRQDTRLCSALGVWFTPELRRANSGRGLHNWSMISIARRAAIRST